MENTSANLGQLSDCAAKAAETAKYMANVMLYGTLQITKAGGVEHA